MVLGIFDKIPHNEEVIYIPHVPDRIQLIRQPGLQLLCRLPIAFLKPFIAEFLKIFPGSQPVRHIILRQLRDPELNLHMAPVRDPLGIVQRLERIREELFHLFGRFHIILPAFIPHPVLIRELLPCLYTEQDIVGLRVFRIRIVDVIGRHQPDSRLLGHL